MLSKTVLGQLPFLAAALATPIALDPRDTSSLEWGPCDFNGTLPIQCANLLVPLDYTNSTSNQKLQLQLVKVPALKQPSTGNILFNFGGPGLEVRNSLGAAAILLQTILGGSQDLIGWDPRGTANTLTFSCYKNATERASAQLINQPGGLGNASDPIILGRTWAISQIFGETCYANPESNSRGDLIGTAFTARDMMQIVDALGGDRLLRYWGFSYGTVLGATAAAMFPDRIERLLLDGVLNPHEYFNGFDIEVWSDSDKTFSSFFEHCVKTPKNCDLARNNITAAQLEENVYGLLDKLKYHPVAFQGLLIDHSVVKAAIRPALYSPAGWPVLATMLDGLMTGDMLKAITAYLAQNNQPIFTGGLPDDSPIGIHCADKRSRAGSLDEMMPVLRALGERSRLFGDIGPSLAMLCAQWKFNAKERYQGNFQNIKTKNPIFVIGNTFDPATPLRSAYNVSSGFEGSVVLEHNAHGHCTLAEPSICTVKAIRAYFTNGTMPEHGSVCNAEYLPFSNGTWASVLPLLA